MSDSKHNVRKGRDIAFADGVERRIKPLTIGQLRKFVPVVDRMGSTDGTNMSDQDIETMLEAAAIILEKVDPALAQNQELLEDTVDILNFNEMMEVAMGQASPEE